MLKTGDLNGMTGGLAIQKRHTPKIQIQRKGRPNQIDQKINYLSSQTGVGVGKREKPSPNVCFCFLYFAIYFLYSCVPAASYVAVCYEFSRVFFCVFQVCAGCVQNTN